MGTCLWSNDGIAQYVISDYIYIYHYTVNALINKTYLTTYIKYSFSNTKIHIYITDIINAGGSMGITDRDSIMEDIQEVKPTVLLTVPMMYNRIYDGVRAKLATNETKAKLFNFGMKVARERREWFDEGKEGFAPLLFLKWNFVQRFIFSSVTNLLGGRIKFCCTGGGALSPIIQQWFGDIGIPMLEGYGLTETSPVVALERYGPTEKTQGGLQAVPGVEIIIVKPNEMEELEHGEEGEICVVGSNIMKGYYKREDATEEVIYIRPDGSNDRVFRTGDLGILSKDNVLKITGRASEQYKLYYAPKFNEWVNSIIPGKLPKLENDSPRLVMPFIDKEGNLFGFNARAFRDNELRYITIMIDEDMPKIFGLDTVNFSKKYYVIEGPIDSLFIDNSVAMAGADGNAKGLENTENAVFVFDNEPRNKEIVSRMERCLNKGYNICIWPEKVLDKDINDVILSGLSEADLKQMIDDNTYRGLEGKLQLSYWKRC